MNPSHRKQNFSFEGYPRGAHASLLCPSTRIPIEKDPYRGWNGTYLNSGLGEALPLGLFAEGVAPPDTSARWGASAPQIPGRAGRSPGDIGRPLELAGSS